MSQTLTLARPYARAAFDTARMANATADWSQALAFAARVAADPSAAALLADPRLQRAQAVALVAPEGAGEAFRSFLQVLADNGRLQVLPEIAGLFDQLCADADNIVRATVTSATALSAADLEGLKAALKRRFGRDIDVDTRIDDSLIGGAIIDAGNVVIDGSLKGKLARLQTALTH